MESRFPKGRCGGLSVAASYGILRMGLKFLIPSGYESAVILLKQILVFVMLLMLAFCFYKAVHAITFFLAVTFMAVSEISFFLAYMVIQSGSRVFDFLSWCFGKGYFSRADAYVRVIKLTAYGLQVLMCVVFILLLFFSLRKIINSYKEKDYAMYRTELLFILIPGLVGWLICLLLRMIMVTVENGQMMQLYDKYPLLLWIVPMILILSLLSVLYSIKLFQDMIYLNREKSGRVILEKQSGSMQEHMTEMERVYSGIRSMKHDMKNTLAVMMQLAAGKGERENTELQAYLSELHQTMDRLEFRFQTGIALWILCLL